MNISMVIIAVLAVGGLVFVSVFATEHIFAPLRHGKRVLKRELRGVGVDLAKLGEDCLDTLVAQCVDAPREQDSNEGRKYWASFKEALRGQAGKVASIIEGKAEIGADDPLHAPLKQAGLVQ